MRLSRRQFIAASTLLAASGPVLWTSRHWPDAIPEGVLLSGFEDLPGKQYVGGVVLPEGRVFGSRVTARVHGNAVNPTNPRRVIFFARRPGTEAFEFDLQTLAVTTAFTTPAGRHLAGHGLFSPDGTLLLTPEHDYETPRGVIGVRDARDFRILGEIATQGLDPHEIAWLPDGRTLIVANGGILTHPRTFRKKLNIPTMDPSLCLIDAASGRCLEQLRLPDHRLSIRHLAVTPHGSVAVGLQYEGDVLTAPSVAALYRPGGGLKLLPVPDHARSQVQGYVASIAVSEVMGLIAAACPYGKGIARWHLGTGEYSDFVAAAEVYGVAAASGGTLVASQRDGTAFDIATSDSPQPLKLEPNMPLRWDDHWTLAPPPARSILAASRTLTVKS